MSYQTPPGEESNSSVLHTKTKSNTSFSNSAKHQREKVLARLRQGPATTIELRSQEYIMMPAARVWELRHRYGYHIDKTWVNRPTECGQLHRVAAYALIKEA